MAIYTLAERQSIIERCEAKLACGESLEDMDYIQLVQCINVSTMQDKLEDFYAVSSSMFDNPRCQARSKCADTICAHCYVKREARKKNMFNALDVNYKIFNTFDIPVKYWAILPIPSINGNVRIESHGDTGSVLHAVNYIRIVKSHKNLHFTPWGKNAIDWAPAFAQEGKPKNLTFVWSSILPNVVDMPKEYVNGYPFAKYVDHVFTVFDKSVAIDKGLFINCGQYTSNYEKISHKCKDCMRCYWVPGRKRKKSKAYLRNLEILGLEDRGADFYIFELRK